ncbi:MAG: patatin family protein [Eubacterium sp.]|nr:patatin family protein [Eubacterium sp.]
MFHCGLVLEGGGSRGVYTSGVLDVFIENGIEFPYVIGVSAGSCNGASFLGKCARRQHDITINYINDKRYMGWRHFISGGEYLNYDWIFGELSYDIMPLNQEEFEKSGAVYCCVVANAKTGKPEYLYPKTLRPRGCPEIRASCALPFFTKGCEIGGELYFDGGLVDSIPLERALEDGCEKAVVILTQFKDYVKQPVNPRFTKLISRKYPNVAAAVENRHNVYNAQLEYVHKMEEEGRALVIQPLVDLDCPTLEKNKAKLESIYQLGRTQGEEMLDKVREFIK